MEDMDLTERLEGLLERLTPEKIANFSDEELKKLEDLLDTLDRLERNNQ